MRTDMKNISISELVSLKALTWYITWHHSKKKKIRCSCYYKRLSLPVNLTPFSAQVLSRRSVHIHQRSWVHLLFNSPEPGCFLTWGSCKAQLNNNWESLPLAVWFESLTPRFAFQRSVDRFVDHVKIIKTYGSILSNGPSIFFWSSGRIIDFSTQHNWTSICRYFYLFIFIFHLLSIWRTAALRRYVNKWWYLTLR